jgi:hypothetical protein
MSVYQQEAYSVPICPESSTPTHLAEGSVSNQVLQDIAPNPKVFKPLRESTQKDEPIPGEQESAIPEASNIYAAVYSGVPVYEIMCRSVAVMRRRSDSYLNATQILKVAGAYT